MSFDPVSFALGAASAKGGPGGSSTLSGLTDVDISNPTDGQTLVYNATSGKWENGAGGGMPMIDATQFEAVITLDITAGNLYTLMQNGPVVYKLLESEGSSQLMSYTRIVIAQTDGVHYDFQDETRLRAEGLTSSATVVFPTRNNTRSARRKEIEYEQ